MLEMERKLMNTNHTVRLRCCVTWRVVDGRTDSQAVIYSELMRRLCWARVIRILMLLHCRSFSHRNLVTCWAAQSSTSQDHAFCQVNESNVCLRVSPCQSLDTLSTQIVPFVFSPHCEFKATFALLFESERSHLNGVDGTLLKHLQQQRIEFSSRTRQCISGIPRRFEYLGIDTI